MRPKRPAYGRALACFFRCQYGHSLFIEIAQPEAFLNLNRAITPADIWLDEAAGWRISLEKADYSGDSVLPDVVVPGIDGKTIRGRCAASSAAPA